MEKNKMKRTLKILIVTLLAAVFAFSLASCGKKKVELSVKEDAMPQSVFVLGEDIDLSSGILLVNKKGDVTELPMNAEGVTVSGYDKNTLGTQTVTVTYMDKSVELTVTVVERMQIVDYTADYLVGDEFDLSAGRVKITRNDGTNYTVMLKSDKVTVNGFNSSTAGEKNVSVSYASGSDVYTANLKVNVHNVENVELTRPTKLTYNSHDSGVDVAGGILTLSALDGKIKKDVTVTKDMIRDFDLTAVNKGNSPLSQIVNVEYDGKLYPFEILITYTPVTEFKSNAHIVADIDWNQEEEPEISELQGTTAMQMMELYLDMSPADQTLLTREETLNMARTAIVYAFNIWGNDIL